MKRSLIKSLIAIAATACAASAFAQKAPFGNLTPAQAALWNYCTDDYSITLNKNSTTTGMAVGTQFVIQYEVRRRSATVYNNATQPSPNPCTYATFTIPVPTEFTVKTISSVTNGVVNSPKTYAYTKVAPNSTASSTYIPPFYAYVGTVPNDVPAQTGKTAPAPVTTITLSGVVNAALPPKVGITTTSNVDYIWEYSPKDNAVAVTFMP